MSSPSDTKPKRPQRPLSPHLQIYKPQITSALSILHRITGVALCGGMVVVVAWLAALARGPEAYAGFTQCARGVVGQIILAGLSFSFYFHLCAGIRHMMWDTGAGLELKEVHKTGRLVIAASILLTAITWLKIYGVSL